MHISLLCVENSWYGAHDSIQDFTPRVMWLEYKQVCVGATPVPLLENVLLTRGPLPSSLQPSSTSITIRTYISIQNIVLAFCPHGVRLFVGFVWSLQTMPAAASCWHGHRCRTETDTLALQVGSWARGWRPRLTVTLLSRNPGNGEAMARKWTETPKENNNKNDLHRKESLP